MPKRTKDYHSWLLKRLAEPREAERYLKVAMADSPEIFLKALRNVAEANKMARVAEEAGVNRESLYKALSTEGNPRFSTLDSVLAALGMELTVKLKQTVPSQSEAPLEIKESEDNTSVRINFNSGNVLQSAGVTLSNNTLLVCTATSSQDEQDAGMADLPPAYMIEAFIAGDLEQKQLAGRA
jgi:probable addiction module antidote protein